jgi:hypothetical protein
MSAVLFLFALAVVEMLAVERVFVGIVILELVVIVPLGLLTHGQF